MLSSGHADVATLADRAADRNYLLSLLAGEGSQMLCQATLPQEYCSLRPKGYFRRDCCEKCVVFAKNLLGILFEKERKRKKKENCFSC